MEVIKRGITSGYKSLSLSFLLNSLKNKRFFSVRKFFRGIFLAPFLVVLLLPSLCFGQTQTFTFTGTGQLFAFYTSNGNSTDAPINYLTRSGFSLINFFSHKYDDLVFNALKSSAL